MNHIECVRDEAARIEMEYARRKSVIPSDRYAVSNPAALFMYQQRVRGVVGALLRAKFFPLAGKRILEVGCGGGGWLVDFESWGVRRQDLTGIELLADRAMAASAKLCAWRDESGTILFPGADIRQGDASKLPWDADSFDLVLQSTVFTSILDVGMKHAVAQEMIRVLKPGGIVLWYDFLFNNPANPQVRGIGKRELQGYFAPLRLIHLRRITLAPPLARRLVPISWLCATALEKSTALNTHYLGVFRKHA